MRVALDVAAGLTHLHKSRIMHLDIKPGDFVVVLPTTRFTNQNCKKIANVLINNLSLHAASCCKLADFGLSQSCDSDAAFKGD
jgi:serine/threonine protein kinase